MELEVLEKNEPKPFLLKSLVNWPIRLEICTKQIELSIKMGSNLDYWLGQGFEAVENCENILTTSKVLIPSDIDNIKKKIEHFKLICKNDQDTN